MINWALKAVKTVWILATTNEAGDYRRHKMLPVSVAIIAICRLITIELN